MNTNQKNNGSAGDAEMLCQAYSKSGTELAGSGKSSSIRSIRLAVCGVNKTSPHLS